MKELVNNFPNQLREAFTIGQSAQLQPATNSIQNVVITGLGGSGIGGTIVSQLVAADANTPILTNKDYTLSGFVGPNTLVIVSSYSGNTEETLAALEVAQQRGAQIACITSGGKVLEIAQANGYNCIQVPDGFPPRAAFAFSCTQLFFVLNHYGIISDTHLNQLSTIPAFLEGHRDHILDQAEKATDVLFQRLPVIYTDASSEGVGVRFRQQMNENSKMLCWHNVYPEMNHNELVGWAQSNEDLAIIFMRNETDNARTQHRMEITKKIYATRTPHIFELMSIGANAIERAMFLIHTGDWISVMLAERKGIDAVEVDVIDSLKDQLAQL